jgi:hypothetical protein
MKVKVAHLAITVAFLAISGCNNPDNGSSATEKNDAGKNETVALGASAPYSPPITAKDTLTSTKSEHRFIDWAGKWIGPEGLFAEIKPTTPAHYDLKIQSNLDTLGTYKGYDSEHGIKFEKDGKTQSLHGVSGDDTGLKYLAGKKECLMIKPGEGFCRD